MSKFANYNEELGINCVDDQEVYATKEKMKKYIPSLEDKDLENFVIVKSKLLYVGTDEKEIEIISRLGIGGSSDSSDAGATVKEIQSIVDGVVDVSEENKEKVPMNDTDKLEEKEHFNDSEGLIGTRLFDRRGVNLTNGNWNILIEYNSQNKEIARYGSGYYWLRKGQKYTIKGEEIDFKNDYVINYKDGEFTVLSGRAVNWNVDATLGVPDEIMDGKHTLALNLDPISLIDGEWIDSGTEDEEIHKNFYNFQVTDSGGKKIDTGIQKVGDVEYSNENKSLKFNESDTNKTGEGGYLQLYKAGVSFKNGFTFEFYGNLSRFFYDNKLFEAQDDNPGLGIFCRTRNLYGGDFQVMRFGPAENGWLGDFSDYGGDCWTGEGYKLKTDVYGDFGFFGDKNFGFDEKNEFYMTIVYTVYDENKDNESYDKFMRSNKGVDKIEYYINGKLYGYTYYDKNAFKYGVDKWDNDDYKFIVGACYKAKGKNIYYLKGDCYLTRLYTKSLNSDEVKLNYDMTLKYRDSFKDE